MTENQNLKSCDVVVVGGGPTGMAACLEAASRGHSVVLCAPSGTHVDADQRTTAIMMPGIRTLEKFGIWHKLKDVTASLDILRIADGTTRLMRAPTVDFRASEIGEAAFGYNVRNRDLNKALSDAVDAQAEIEKRDVMVSAVRYDADFAQVILSNGDIIETKLVIGADGSQSIVRQAAGVDTRKWTYPQTALVLTFKHGRPHDNISTEFHRETGPFTQVPLPGDESSLVWVVRPEQADDYMALDDDALGMEIEKHMQSMLGKVTLTSRPQKWPLSSSVAEAFGSRRMVLVGHAAHAFPPIGAQGLNLGLRDVTDLGEALDKAIGDPGADGVTSTYNRMRRADIWVRTGAVDLLNRSLLTDFLPVQAVRALGLSVLRMTPALRGLFMRHGMAPGRGLNSMLPTLPFSRRRSKQTDRSEEAPAS